MSEIARARSVALSISSPRSPICGVNNLNVNSPGEQHRNHSLQLAIPHQRISANNGKVNWFQSVDKIEHSVDEFLTLIVAQASQDRFAAEVRVMIRITSWAAQGTLSG